MSKRTALRIVVGQLGEVVDGTLPEELEDLTAPKYEQPVFNQPDPHDEERYAPIGNHIYAMENRDAIQNCSVYFNLSLLNNVKDTRLTK